jgi:hypothetical protein
MPLAPSQGGRYNNPITFKWRGSLSAGQTYQVTAILVKFPQYVVKSPLQTTSSWKTFDLDKGIGAQEYRWKVSVISDGKELIASPEWAFWFDPLGAPQPP